MIILHYVIEKDLIAPVSSMVMLIFVQIQAITMLVRIKITFSAILADHVYQRVSHVFLGLFPNDQLHSTSQMQKKYVMEFSNVCMVRMKRLKFVKTLFLR